MIFLLILVLYCYANFFKSCKSERKECSQLLGLPFLFNMLSSQRSRNLLLPNYFLLKIWDIPSTQTRPLNTLSSLLNLCTKPQQLNQIQARFVLHGLHENPTISSKLIDSYAKFGLPNLSQQVFDSVSNPSSVLYNAMLGNFVMLGQFERAISVYREMVEKRMYPVKETYPFVLRSFCCLGDVENGESFHGYLVKLGLDSCRLVRSALEDFYWQGADKTDGGCGNEVERFRLFKRMRIKSVDLNAVTLINLLRSSVDLNLLSVGKVVHCLVLVSNLGKDLAVNTALLSMYAKLGAVGEAGVLFEKMPERDCVVWNIMISANSQNRRPKDALWLLSCMGRSGIRADLFTALPAISSIAQLKAIEQGKQMHAHVIRNGIDYQVSVHNSLIDMYCQCDQLDLARKIFDLVNDKTLITWSAMMKGYVTHDQSPDALSLFFKMKSDGIKADFVTVINILPACVNIGALENVKYLHGYSMKSGMSSLSSLNTAILVSYAKCGCIEVARKIFNEEKINDKDVITWNSMISAYAKHGDWKQCFELYNQVKQLNIKPDQVTFLGVLTACVNSGLVKEGKGVFKEMVESYGCLPNQEHYACMVDLLGRAGHIDDARELVKSMPFEPDARVWGPLLSACKMTNSETGLAEYAAKKLITMEPKNAGNYILLSNIYAAAGKWDRVAKMRSVLRDRGLKKTPGCSWLEINGRVHEFRVADRSHPRSNDIYTILGNLELEIKDAKNKKLENTSETQFFRRQVFELHISFHNH